MTLAEAAERSACSPKTIRRAIDAGQLVAVRLGASARSDRVHPADLEDWWERSRRASAVLLAVPKASQSAPRPGSADERLAALLAPTNGRTKGRRRTDARQA
ncbi:TPA: helix-turn-helix domain-containing protein [Stenotrophomonas maltophilia]|nr:helix-turn-helix domain-containing protein [Stenotrophomonas maltophilia]HDX0845796.1 helix-turn-helix domain-containing protein [Stenotrophomonas maltophilia]